jgi:hypothetical protein
MLSSTRLLVLGELLPEEGLAWEENLFRRLVLFLIF